MTALDIEIRDLQKRLTRLRRRRALLKHAAWIRQKRIRDPAFRAAEVMRAVNNNRRKRHERAIP